MTKFKVGDKVRHIYAMPTPREIVAVENNLVCVRGARDMDPSLEVWQMSNIAIVEEAEPRKRLREYTDLADGDVVVIAGVPMTVNAGVLEQDGCEPEWNVYAEMLVDEVRRKPRTKKRRVYEEVDRDDARGDEVFIGASTWRLVEETEVPR